MPRHKAAEVSRGHSTSKFFFEGRAEHYGTQLYHKIRALVQRQPHRFFFSRTGLLPEVRTESGDKAGELIQRLHPGKTANDNS